MFVKLTSLHFLATCLCLVMGWQGSRANSDPESMYIQGQALYRQVSYEEARRVFEELVELVPDISTYNHWLARCYGRIAENANWLNALSLAQKTRESLERAVELDNTNIPALEDLQKYYLEAPGFLGGSKEKAQQIAERIKNMELGENNSIIAR